MTKEELKENLMEHYRQTGQERLYLLLSEGYPAEIEVYRINELEDIHLESLIQVVPFLRKIFKISSENYFSLMNFDNNQRGGERTAQQYAGEVIDELENESLGGSFGFSKEILDRGVSSGCFHECLNITGKNSPKTPKGIIATMEFPKGIVREHEFHGTIYASKTMAANILEDIKIQPHMFGREPSLHVHLLSEISAENISLINKSGKLVLSPADKSSESLARVELLTNVFSVKVLQELSSDNQNLKTLEEAIKWDNLLRSFEEEYDLSGAETAELRSFIEGGLTKSQIISRISVIVKNMMIKGRLIHNTEYHDTIAQYISHEDQDLAKLIEFGKDMRGISNDEFVKLVDECFVNEQDESKSMEQIFGTKGKINDKGVWQPYPIKDLENIDSTRAEKNQISLKEHIEKMNEDIPVEIHYPDEPGVVIVIPKPKQ